MVQLKRVVLCFAAVAVIAIAATAALSQQDTPFVVFIEERSLQMASVTDNGPDGLTRLADLIHQQNVRTGFIRLDEPIPDDADLVVLARPRTPLSAQFLSRIWVHLENGGSFLMMVDAPGQGGSPDARNGGADRLFGWEYGVGLYDGLIVQPWYTAETIRSIRRSTLYVYPDNTEHPVITPLVDYGLPVMMWGARNIRSEFFAPFGYAVSLLQADGVYGETNRDVYRFADPAPLEINIGTDQQGRLSVGALAENEANNSRIAIIGDGEVFQNDYGLAVIPGSQTPFHAGNYVLAQRLIGWLLKLPVEAWQPLPNGFTWLSIDGQDDDWSGASTVTADDAGDVGILSQDIQQIHGFRNQDSLYLLISTASTPDPMAQVQISVDRNGDRTVEGVVFVTAEGTRLDRQGAGESVPDAQIGVGDFIEIRVPLRAAGLGGILPQVCLTTSRDVAFKTSPDCVTNVAVPLVDQRDPVELAFADSILAAIESNVTTVNLRSGPGADFNIVGNLRTGQIAAVVGRSEDSGWIYIRTTRLEGWINAQVVQVNTDVEALPIMPPA